VSRLLQRPLSTYHICTVHYTPCAFSCSIPSGIQSRCLLPAGAAGAGLRRLCVARCSCMLCCFCRRSLETRSSMRLAITCTQQQQARVMSQSVGQLL
jgi:hypothetical protein